MRTFHMRNLHDGRYGLFEDSNLTFTINDVNRLEIDKKSALEIATTLFDSMNMLSKEVEELLCDIEEKINGN